MRLLITCDRGRGLGGFGHLAQYNAVRTWFGCSNWRGVMHHFVRFKFFAEQAFGEEAGRQAIRAGAR